VAAEQKQSEEMSVNVLGGGGVVIEVQPVATATGVADKVICGNGSET